ncbi:MAG: ATP cone domain-containing protein [Rhizonema sp. PD38]|nr:ATP cone domain-containing protein [Rhizonema sp. PD38]
MQATSTPSLDSTTDIRVVRRDGSTTPLEINKIGTVVNWACRQIQANSIALEAGVTTRLRSGITTREIQDNLIRCALDLCSPEKKKYCPNRTALHS